MNEHFITEIEIKNFKCFEDFKAEGFGRVNLIGGKNNVGKTAFMEAVYVNVHSEIDLITNSIIRISLMRWLLEYFSYPLSTEELRVLLEKAEYIKSSSNLNQVEFEVIDQNGKKEYFFNINDKSIKINVNDFSFSFNIHNLDKNCFISSYGFLNGQLKRIFESVQKKDKENELYKYISSFDSNIINFKIIGGGHPQCKTQDGDYRIINEFGDGLKHFISVICTLYACENGYLFIDEIDNGIHYTQLDRLWEIILTISKEQNVQVFATTHSKECIESYARVAKRLGDEEVTYTVLTKLKSGEIHAGVRNLELLDNSISQEHEVR